MITFTDAQLKSATLDLVTLDDTLNAMDAQKGSLVDKQDAALNKDDTNAVFYTESKDTLEAYFTELEKLNAVVYTRYDDANMLAAAQSVANNVHFPQSPIWVNFVPKLIPSLNGLPTSTGSGTELAAVTALSTQIALLKTGFADGALTDTLAVPYTGGTVIEVTLGGFGIGNRLVLDNAGNSMLAVVTGTQAPITGVQALIISVLVAPVGTLPMGTRTRNFHAGFSNSEREGATTPYAPAVMTYWESLVDTKTTSLDAILTNEKNALLSNGDLAPDKTQNTQALADVNSAKNNITSYFALDPTGANQQYSDFGLAYLISVGSNRTAQVPARITQIVASLGSVSQTPDGAYSGSGEFYNFFQLLNLRVNLVAGTLSSYYGLGVGGTAVDNTKNVAQDKGSQYATVLLASKLAIDTDGTTTVSVDDATGFSNGDTVYVIDDVQVFIAVGTIQSINANNLILDVTVSGFTVFNNAGEKTYARVAKYL